MIKYPIFNKYFNRTPRGYLLFLFIFVLVTNILGIILSFALDMVDMISIASIVWPVVFLVYIFINYKNQFTLTKARIGKHLKATYNLDDASLEAAFDMIERELGAPIYADATEKRKFNAFFVTQNWLVGTDGVMLLRANACRRDSIKNIEMNCLTRYRKGYTCYYYVLQVTDFNDHVYRFYLRSKENMEMAYNFLVGNYANS